MSYFKRQNSSNHTYSKLNKEDPEDTVHRKAQFLIYKAMEEANTVGGGGGSHYVKKTSTMSFLRMRFCKVKVKIGSRFKSLRRRVFSTVSVSKAATCMHIIKKLKSCNKRLFGAAGEAAGTVAGIPSLLI